MASNSSAWQPIILILVLCDASFVFEKQNGVHCKP
jgi:hypothetical protein